MMGERRRACEQVLQARRLIGEEHVSRRYRQGER